MLRILVLGLGLLGAMNFARGQAAANSSGPDTAPAPDAGAGAPPPESEPEDNDTSPLHQALLAYKSGHYDEALTAIDAAEKAKPGDVRTELLKAKILTEQHEYDEGEKLLRSLLTPTGPVEVQLGLGDLLLRKHSFDRAAKYYALALAAKPNDPDITLKLVYAKIGVADLISAGDYASHLSPLDPKNPYDAHASYYFAKAALAQATGNVQGAEDQIQVARTFYGNTVTDRYLKTYLEVFAAPDKGANTDLVPSPLIKPTQQ
jgi:tetratricopeptide (TPR) repeat protein